MFTPSLAPAYQVPAGMVVKSIVYTVPSATEPGVTYQVALNPLSGRPQSCTCPARRECWHRKAVAAGAITSKPRVRIGPAAPARPAYVSPVPPHLRVTADDLFA